MKARQVLFGFPLVELLVVALIIGAFFSGPVLVTEYTIETDSLSVVDSQVYNETKKVRVEFIPLQTNYSITTNATIINDLGMEFNVSSFETVEVVSAGHALFIFMVLIVAGYSVSSILKVLEFAGINKKYRRKIKSVGAVFQFLGHFGLTLFISMILSNVRILRRTAAQDNILFEAETSDIYVRYSGFTELPSITLLILASPILMILRAQLVKSGTITL